MMRINSGQMPVRGTHFILLLYIREGTPYRADPI